MGTNSEQACTFPQPKKCVHDELEVNLLESDISQFTTLIQNLHVPLISITGLCQKILTLPQIPQNDKHDANTIIANAKKLDELIQKLQDFSNNILSYYPEWHAAEANRKSNAPNEALLFLESVFAVIRQNISNSNLSPSFIADNLNLSTRNLYRKLNDTCKKSPAELIRSCRFNYVRHLLLTSSFTITEVIYKSGFSSKACFFKSFHEKYNCTPKEYRKKLRTP